MTTIDQELEIMYQDSGQWRSFTLVSEGVTYKELIDNAHIFEIDQDGGELNDYSLEDATNEIIKTCESIIENTVGVK